MDCWLMHIARKSKITDFIVNYSGITISLDSKYLRLIKVLWFFETFQTVFSIKRNFSRQLSICCLIKRQQIESYSGNFLLIGQRFKNQTLGRFFSGFRVNSHFIFSIPSSEKQIRINILPLP